MVNITLIEATKIQYGLKVFLTSYPTKSLI